MASVIYKATVHVGDQHVPVKLLGALEDRRVHFRLLHASDRVPVVQQMVRAGTDEPVPKEELRKGYEVEPGRFVVLSPQSLAALEPPSDRRIDVDQVVPRTAVPVSLLDRPYHLAPEGAEGPYFALARALDEVDRVGIAHFTMRKRRHHAVLLGEQDHLMLITLHDPRTLVLPSSLPAVDPVAIEPRQLQLAELLVEAMRASFDPGAFRDEHRDRVLELIERKREGRSIPRLEPRSRPAPDDLAAALEQSLRQVEEQRVA